DVPAASEPDPAFMALLEDDLNTPGAIARLHGLADAANAGSRTAAAELRAAAQFLGVLGGSAQTWFQETGSAEVDRAAIDALIARRTSARKARDFAEADRIRKELEGNGVVLEDTAAGTTWRLGA